MLRSTLLRSTLLRSITRPRSIAHPPPHPATFTRPISVAATATLIRISGTALQSSKPPLAIQRSAMSTTSSNANTPPAIADSEYTPEELSFQLRNGIVLKARHWKTGGEDAKPRDCRRFLAVHGFLDNASSFDLLAPLLLKQLGPEPVEIVALDLAGHGLSSHRTTEDYALWRYVEDADQVVEQLGWHRHAIIGHSMGAAISTLYAGLYESRLTMCILLDNFGPLTRDVKDQPQHLLEHIKEKRALATKRLAFHPTIESACTARSQSGAYSIQPDFARVLMPRGLKPAQRTMDDGTVVQGWTWTTDPLLTIRSAQSLSEGYSKAFMSRICCPILGVLADGGFLKLTTVINERIEWIQKAKTTIKGVQGNHSVHMESAPKVAEKISSWILEQDIARL